MENSWHKQKASGLCILGFKGLKHEPWFWRSFPTQWACTSFTWSCAAPVDGLINGLLELSTPINGVTLPETNLAPENGPSQKESSLPTASFRGYVSFREGISPLDTFTWFLCPSPIIFTWVGHTSLTSKSSSALRRTVQAWKGFAMPRPGTPSGLPSFRERFGLPYPTKLQVGKIIDFLKSANWWYVIYIYI